MPWRDERESRKKKNVVFPTIFGLTSSVEIQKKKIERKLATLDRSARLLFPFFLFLCGSGSLGRGKNPV